MKLKLGALAFSLLGMFPGGCAARASEEVQKENAQESSREKLREIVSELERELAQLRQELKEKQLHRTQSDDEDDEEDLDNLMRQVKDITMLEKAYAGCRYVAMSGKDAAGSMLNHVWNNGKLYGGVLSSLILITGLCCFKDTCGGGSSTPPNNSNDS